MANSKRNFLISGVSSGIGKAFFELLESKGENVIPILRNKEQASSANLKNAIIYDFAKPDTIEDSFKNLKDEIDVFINFAGILPGKSFLEYELESIQEIFNVNVISPLLITKVITNKLSKNAVLIYIGSISAQKGSYDDAYAATKGAIHSLIKSLAIKFAPEKRVLGIAPAMIENTRMTDELIEGRFEHNLKKIPLAKAGNPKEISELIYFLTGDNCSFMTGALIDINGGQYLR
jgi:3-oxoacyl-[acyl-carrier protein] reductase